MQTRLGGLARRSIAVGQKSFRRGVLAALAVAALCWPDIGHAQLAIHVQGNQLVNQNGTLIHLHGVDFDGTEYACVGGGNGSGNGYGVFDWPDQANPPNYTSFIAAMKTWHINAVRLPLNETCWNGTLPNPPLNPAYAGVNYQSAIASFVQALTDAGMYVILDLHWAAPGSNVANTQWAMADNDNSPSFWFSVATAYKNNPAVIFDLFNEPAIQLGGETGNGDFTVATAADWACWLNGCTIPAGAPRTPQTYQAAGMQQLLTEVRAAGATQPVLVAGEFYAQDLTQWLSYLPNDPTPNGWPQGQTWTPQIAADYHRYCGANCQSQIALDQQYEWSPLQTIAQSHPVMAGEFGEYDCATGYVYGFMDFFDANGFSYLGWSWNNSSCGNPSLLAATTGTNQDYYAATPTAEGQGLDYHLQALYRLHDTHDFNNAGKSDIAWRNTSTGDVAIWQMNGAAISQASDFANIPPAAGWSIVGQRDFNGDGDADLLWHNANGDLSIWLMNGAAVAQTGDFGIIPTSWTVAGTGDFNADGKGDILWRNTSTGDVAIWLMNGTTLSQASDFVNVPVATGWTIAGTGDFNGDGMTDILWRNTTTGDVTIWLMNGATVTQATNFANVPVASGWTIVGTGDFNDDGMSDILWRNTTTGDVSIWLMNGASIKQAADFANVPIASGWTIAETGDFDGNGTADILWRNSSTGDVSVWLMNGTTIGQATDFANVPVASGWTIQGLNAD